MIVVENRDILLLFVNVKQFHYPYFLIRCWLQFLTTDKQSSYYKVYGESTILEPSPFDSMLPKYEQVNFV